MAHYPAAKLFPDSLLSLVPGHATSLERLSLQIDGLSVGDLSNCPFESLDSKLSDRQRFPNVREVVFELTGSLLFIHKEI